MNGADWATLTTAIGAVVTAIATLFLWRVTAVLAKETTRLADASGQPQVVATLRPSRWSIIHCELTVANTGNASAFGVTANFRSLEDFGTSDSLLPANALQKISVLRPGEAISTYVGRSHPLTQTSYEVTTSWLRNPSTEKRETLVYTHSLADFTGVRQLGSDPMIQIAEQIKSIKESVDKVVNGSSNIGADIYTSQDRRRHKRAQMREFREWKRQQSSDDLPR